jgi:DNA-binding transcriptional LysR family regulator
MNFDMDCLRSFVLVADHMSVSRAAESLCRSQSTVSQQIGKLEAQLSRRLLVRRKGRVFDLTLDGGKLLQYARRILQINDEAYASMSEDALIGFVRLGVPLDFFGRDFTTWLARFKNQHPMVGLEIESNQSENLLKRCERGEFDLAFFKQEAGSTNGTVALSEQLVWVAGGSYVPILNQSVPLILFPEGCAYRRFAVAALRSNAIPWHTSFVSPSFECLRTAVAEGLGITVLARALVVPPMRIVSHSAGLPSLPMVELAYAHGRKNRSRVVGELARHLTDSLTATNLPGIASAA